MAVTLCLSCCLDVQPEAKELTLLGAGFLYCILSATSLDPTHQGPKPLGPCVAFTTTTRLKLAATQLARRTQLSNIIVQRPLDLWNWMFNRHQAKITVMQFKGLSHPEHLYMSVPWEFFSLVPFYQTISTHAISSHTCHQNVPPLYGASPWNGIFGWVKRSKYNTIFR